MDWSGKTHLLSKEKYNCRPQLLLDRFGFNETSESVDNFNVTNQLSVTFTGIPFKPFAAEMNSTLRKVCYK